MHRVRGKVALVTGGAMGIGRSACTLLAREGASIAIADVADEPGRRLADELRATGATTGYWHLDVADEAMVRSVFADVERVLGRSPCWSTTPGFPAPTSRPTS